MNKTTMTAIATSALALTVFLGTASASADDDARQATCRGQEATIVDSDGDVVHGTNGRDVVVSDGGFIYGHRGDDLICGANQAFGGRGDDVIVRPWAFGNGGPGDDRFYGGRAYDAFIGGRGDDKMIGRKTMDWFVPGPGNDEYFGGAGRDMVGYHGKRDVRVNLAKGRARGMGKDRLHSVQDFAGGQGTYVVVGNRLRNVFEVRSGTLRARGRGGNDRFRVAGGDDSLRGGRGNDSLRGGRGNDSLRGGHGDDVLRGGRGDDRGRGGPGRDRCTGVEHVRGCEA